jgi:hypothetical protein
LFGTAAQRLGHVPVLSLLHSRLASLVACGVAALRAALTAALKALLQVGHPCGSCLPHLLSWLA